MNGAAAVDDSTSIAASKSITMMSGSSQNLRFCFRKQMNSTTRLSSYRWAFFSNSLSGGVTAGGEISIG